MSVVGSWCLLVFSVISPPHGLSWNPQPPKWLTFSGEKGRKGGQEAEGRRPNVLDKEKLSQKTPESEVQGVMSTTLSQPLPASAKHMEELITEQIHHHPEPNPTEVGCLVGRS